MSRLALPLTVLALAACGSRTTQPATSPDNRPTVEVWKEDLEDNSNSSVLMARNDGTTPVTITEVRLTVCDNLYQDCGIHAPNVRVEPGQTVRVMRLDPSNHARRPRFGWEFRWRGVPTVATATTVPRTTIVSRGMIGGAIDERPVEALRPAVAAEDGDGRCVAPRTANLPPGYRRFEMRWGQPGQPPRRTARVDLDAAGTVVRYHESRGDMRVPPPGVAAPQPVADRGARTDISIDGLQGTALVLNVHVDGSSDQQAASGPDLLEATSLDRPITLIQRMTQECAGT